MKRFIGSFGLVACLCALAAPRLLIGADAAVEARAVKEAQAEAQEWLKLVDDGKYPEAWERAARDFQRVASKKKWPAMIGAMRTPAGKLVSRKVKSSDYTKELAGAPKGEYVIVEFESAFEKKPSATETVTVFAGTDLKWRVAGYRIK